MRFNWAYLVLFLFFLPLLNNFPFDLQNSSDAADVSGPVWGTWTESNSPYYVNDNITIPFGETLLIEPGVDVILNGSYRIFVGGRLLAPGTSAKEINFRTNSSVPSGDGMGDWHGIMFNSTGTGNLQNCTIINASAGIRLNNSKNVIINNTDIEYNNIAILIENNSYNNSFNNCNCNFNMYGFYVENSNYNDIIDCNVLYNMQYGMLFEDSSFNTINGSIIQWNGMGVRFKGESQNNSILNSNIRYNAVGGGGVGLEFHDGAKDNLVLNSNIFENPLEIINVSNSNIIIKDCTLSHQLIIERSSMVTITGCTFSTWGVPKVISLSNVENIEISYCFINTNSIGIVLQDGSRNVSILHSTIDCSDSNDGIVLWGSSSNTISYCTLQNCYSGIGFYGPVGSDNNSINNCTISGNTFGINFASSKNNVIDNNIFNHNDYGFMLLDCSETLITGCEVSSSFNYGIQFYNCSNIQLENSKSHENSNYGLAITDYSDNIQITNSEFYQNSHSGFRLNRCSNVSFDNCTFNDNRIGLYVYEIENVEIYNSKFNQNSDNGLVLDTEELLIYNSEFNENSNYGIEIYSGKLYLENCSVLDNNNAIDLAGGATAYFINTTYNNGAKFDSNEKLYVGWFLDIAVRTLAGSRVPSAVVKLIPRNDDYENLTEHHTDATGWARQIVCYEYMKSSEQLISYNPYRIETHKEGIGGGSIILSITKSRDITLVLESKDLILTSISISWPNGRVPVNESFNITLEIDNTAQSNFNDVEVSIWIAGYYIDSPYTFVILTIPANSKIIESLPHPPISSLGDYIVDVKIDYNNKILEISEENNELSHMLSIVERPVAVLQANRTSIFEGESIMFYANKSYGAKTILEYIFDFDDGSDVVGIKTSNKIDHVFAKSGNYEVRLQVKDIDEIPSEFDNEYIVVKPRAEPPPPEDLPVANFTITPESGDITTVFRFDPSSSIPSSGATIIKYIWDLGDENTSTFTGPTHDYGDDGIYTVTLTVKDSLGRTSLAFNRTIIVMNQPPIINLTVNQNIVNAGEPVTFYANRTSDIDDSLYEPQARFIWYFGDINNTSYSESSIQYPDGNFDMVTQYIYTDPGEYIVTLVVYDDDGARNQTSIKITVLPADGYKNGDKADDDMGIFGLGKVAGIDVLFLVIVLIIIVIIILIMLFLLLRRKKKEASEETTEPSAGEIDYRKIYSRPVSEDPYRSGVPGDYYQDIGAEPFYDLADDTGYAKKPSKAKKPKHESKTAIKKSRTSSIRPVEVDVSVPKEKVVPWKDETAAAEHKLSLDEVGVVSDRELIDASLIGINGELDEELVKVRAEPDADTVEWEFTPTDEEAPEEFSEIKFEEVPDEIEPEEEFEAIIEEEELEPEEPKETLVFEFEEDGETKSQELDIKPAEPEIKPKPKPKIKRKKSEQLIPIPGIGFVKRGELQRILGMESDEFDDIDLEDFNLEDYQIPDGVPLKLDDSLVSEPELLCKWCDKPIKGKYIKFRRKAEDGTKLAIVGPFCSQECADRFGR